MTIEALYTIYNQHPVVTTDSRQCPQGSLFFALKGESFDGNLYAAAALEKGCSYAVVDNPEIVANERYILIPNVLKCLQELAHYHRKRLNTPVIGITGTNGKTTTKELIAAILSEKYNILFTQGNFNNHIGVPLTLLQLNASHQLAVIEMGANHPGEIAELAAIAAPNYGLITNVGKAHLEGFGSFEGVIATKAELYNYLKESAGQAFINLNNAILLEQWGDMPFHSYALDNILAQVKGEIVENNPFITLQWNYEKRSYEAKTHFIGSYNGENMLAAIAIGYHFQVSDEEIKHALQTYEPSNNRSQFTLTESNRIIVDAYNANPTSMCAALTNFEQMQAEHKMVILGDMLELGNQSLEEHQHIVDQLKEMQLERVILIGNTFKATHHAFEHFDTKETLIEALQKEPINNATLLLKGSHGIALEKCIPYL